MLDTSKSAAPQFSLNEEQIAIGDEHISLTRRSSSSIWSEPPLHAGDEV
jgi:hypothetical protein